MPKWISIWKTTVTAYRFFVPRPQADPHMTFYTGADRVAAQAIRGRARFTISWSNAGIACMPTRWGMVKFQASFATWTTVITYAVIAFCDMAGQTREAGTLPWPGRWCLGSGHDGLSDGAGGGRDATRSVSCMAGADGLGRGGQPNGGPVAVIGWFGGEVRAQEASERCEQSWCEPERKLACRCARRRHSPKHCVGCGCGCGCVCVCVCVFCGLIFTRRPFSFLSSPYPLHIRCCDPYRR